MVLCGRRLLSAAVTTAAVASYFAGSAVGANSMSADAGAQALAEVPAWAFPLNPASPDYSPPFDRVKPLRLPHSDRTYTEAQLNDLFAAPDWQPKSHTAMPEVVAHGRAPDV